MRLTLIAIVLCACGKTPLEKPDPAALQRLTYEAQCEAVAPRAGRCANELMIADLESLARSDGMDVSAIVDDMRRDDDLSSEQARSIARHSCMGTATETFPARVLACWDEDDCTRFAACVTRP